MQRNKLADRLTDSSAGKTLKELYPSLMHVTCVAHLPHNCAMRVRAHFKNIEIKDYINKRLSNSDLETIINCTNLTIDPTSYALLQKAQPTSAAVERSFSMLNKLLRKDRNFDVKNVKNI